MLSTTRRAILAMLLATPLAAHGQTAPTELNFGLVATDGSQNLRAKWEPFLHDMQEAIGMKVNGFYPSDYAGVVEAMRFGKVQIAWYGNASAIQAVDRADGEVFVQKSYANGSLGYYSLLIVNRDSPLKSLEDVIHAAPGTLNFGNGDPNSTSGFLIPSYYAWAKNGVDIRKLFKNIVTGSHGVNLLAVANKQVDVATNNTEDLENFHKAHPEQAALIRPIWKSPIIPADPIVWRKDLPDPVKQKVRAFFLAYGTERPGADLAHEQKVLADLGEWGTFHVSSDAQLLPIRQVAAFRERLTTENNANLSPEEKAKRLEEIDARLKALDAQQERAKTAAN